MRLAFITCAECGRNFWARPVDKRVLCSLACLGTRNARIYQGSRNPKWKGGRFTERDGRVLRYAPEHHEAKALGRTHVYEYRLIAEAKIGRHLHRDEVVHHINGDPADNRPENLQVMTQAEHARLEMRGRFLGTTHGVSRRGNRWRARITVDGKEKWLGVFDLSEDALNAVRQARRVYWK